MKSVITPWFLLLLGLHLVIDKSHSSPYFSKDVRILCRDTVCQAGTECRVELQCLGCRPRPICIEVTEYLDLSCPNTTLAVVIYSKPSVRSSFTKTDSSHSKYEAFSCYEMNECPVGSVCILDFCCYD